MSVPSFLAAKTGSGSLLNVWTLAVVHLPPLSARLATDLVSTHAMLPWHLGTSVSLRSHISPYFIMDTVPQTIRQSSSQSRLSHAVMRGRSRLCIAILCAGGWKLQVGYHFKFYSRELSSPTSQLPVVIKRKNTAERGEGGETNEILN